MKTVYAAILNILFLSANCFSQIYSTNKYTPDDGLATRTVYDITQDSTGRMWFATGVGISRYDGYKFENFDFTKEVSKFSYRRIKTDEKGFVWCIPYFTRDSIRVFRNNLWVSIPPPSHPNLFNENASFDLYYENGNHVLCLGTSDGIFLYKDDKWKRYAIEEGLINNEVLNVCAYNKKYYISTKKGLSIFNSGTFDNSLNSIISKEPTIVLKVYFQDIHTDNRNEKARMWLLLPNKLGYIENNTFKVLNSDFAIPDLVSYLSYSMVIDSRNNIYFGSSWVKYYININNGKLVGLFKENGLVSNGCTSIFLDREDNLWISDTRGLCKLNSLAFRNHNSSIGMEEDDVASMNELTPGKYVFGHNHGITISENNRFKYISFKTFKNYKPNSSRVIDINKDKNGNLWLSVFSMGIGRIDNSGNIEWMKVPDSTTFGSVISDDNGDIIASANNGLYIYKNGTFERYYKEISKDIYLRKLFNLSDGKIWTASPRGIYIFENQNMKHIKSENNLLANSVFSIFKDNKNRIFAGTLDGLYILQNDSMFKFNENNFSIDDPVYAMIQDKNNNYWIGTNKNLVFWDGDNTKKEYNSRNGLVQGEINRSALFIDSDERLWIGTDMGVSRYVSELDNEKSYIPKLELTGIVENGGNYYPVDGDLSFGNKENNLKFLFRGISFVNENSIEYKVKLEGYDKDWVIVNQQRIEDVVYKNLKPGEYVFKVKARNNSGEWSREIASKTITIENPFYFKLWFIVLVILFVVIGFLAFYFHIGRQKYLTKLETEVEKRTAELNNSKEDLIKANERLEERVKERTSELEESEREFRELVELLPEAIYETDNEGKVVFTNKAGFEKFGYGSGDLGKVSVLDVVVSEDKERAGEYFHGVISGKAMKGIEFKALKKDGSTFPIYINSVPVITKGEISGARGIALDVTSQKIIEEKLKKLSEEQKELIASKDKFFSILAHDLRNPFTGLCGFAEVLFQEGRNLSKEEIVNYSEHIKKSADSILKLLENLLQWGRLQTGKMDVKSEKINLYEIVNESIALLLNNSGRKEISVKNKIENNVYVNADSNMLDSIIQNLLINSVKFTPRKGTIEFSAEKSGNMIHISITDTGIGMNDEQLNDIFRIDKRNTTLGTENEPGTGLGVILCKEMIEKQGGKIEIKSEIGKGSVIKFCLPAI
jgi:PAS domain S-box-containing protein